MMERTTHRLRVVFDARKNGTLHQSQKGYTAYMHPGLLKNPHVWMVDGTVDCTRSQGVIFRNPVDFVAITEFFSF